MVKIISIEGNIGSGKSTLVHMLKKWFSMSENKVYNNNGKQENVVFLEEPIEEWNTITNKNGKTMIELFYESKEKYSFAFQMMAYISRLSILKKTIEDNPNSIIICERSLYTDKNVFAKMLYDDGYIEEVEYKIYTKWFHSFIQESKIDTIFYIQTHPSICYERVHKRNRKGEETIPLTYLDRCNTYHNDWLISKCETSTNCFILNGNLDRDENIEGYRRMLEYIQRNL